MIKYSAFFKSRYFWVTMAFLVWLLIFDNYSYLEHRILNKEIEELEVEKKFRQEEIKKDCLQIKKFKKLEEVERYAREKYYMKKPNEDVFIIEYEDKALNEQQHKTN